VRQVTSARAPRDWATLARARTVLRRKRTTARGAGPFRSRPNVFDDDELSKKKDDLVDWRKVGAPRAPGVRDVPGNWEDPAAELKLEVFNDEGRPSRRRRSVPGSRRAPRCGRES